MMFKHKEFQYELECGAGIDLGFWALPLSICWIRIHKLCCLDGGFHLLFRFLCVQFSIECWKWSGGAVDVETTTVEDMING